MHVVQRGVRQSSRRMHSPYERGVVSNRGVGNGVRYNYNGLGEVDGLFNIGKMFTRMFTFKPSSFQLKNIAGAIGSVVTTIGTGGLIAFAPKIQSAKSSISKGVGYGTMAAAAATGLYFGGSALLSSGTGASALTTAGAPAIGTAQSGSSVIGAATGQAAAGGGGFWSATGSILSNVGSGLMTGVKFLTSLMPVLGGVVGGGQQQQQAQQGGMTQAEYDAYMAQQAAAQAEYDKLVAAQQAQMYQPVGYTDMGYGAQPASMNTSYGDLRSPYTAITEDGEQVQVDPNTGQIIQPGISTGAMVMIGGVALLAGWYFMSGSKESN